MVKMIGIDHTTAPVDIRSEFSYKKSELAEQMTILRDELDASGIVIISTCNRMELWVSMEATGKDITAALLKSKNLEKSGFENYFVERQGDEAIEHLMLMTSGLKSAIIAEDQILTQVKEAISFSREAGLSDGTLDVLFRTAITAAKKIKTEIVFHRTNTSAIDQALKLMEEKNFSVEGKKCLVIGNGEYGRLVSNMLVERGAKVTVTIRQYHSGQVLIPKGCDTILYGDRYSIFSDCHMVVSATTSPNYTLSYEMVNSCKAKHPIVLVDLAVPRDIEPEIKELPGYMVFDIDDFKSELGADNRDALEHAYKIIQEKTDEFRSWNNYRDMVPLISDIKERASKDIVQRMEKMIKKLEQDIDKEELASKILDASGKVIANIFYHMRDTLDEETYKKCVNAVWEWDNE